MPDGREQSRPGQDQPSDRTPRAELLGNPIFIWFLVARFNVLMVQRILAVSVGWHIYEISGRALDLAYVGLAMFLPVPMFVMVAGDFGDRFNRAGVVALAFAGMSVVAAGFVLVAASADPAVGHLLLLTFLFGTSIIFMRPMLTAMVSGVSTARTLPMAVAWSALAGQTATIIGPAVAGLLLLFGVDVAYWATLLLAVGGALAALKLLPVGLPSGIPATPKSMWSRTLEGIVFVWRTPVILGAATLDLLATMLGSVTILLPIFVKDILEGGPLELGLLRAAPAVGATLVAIPFTSRSIDRHAGPILLGAIASFGAFTVVFALSQNFVLSFVALAMAGLSDMVGVILRQSVLQLATPDHMRGRVSAVQQFFVSGSNDIGDARAGLVAAWLGAAPAALMGGISIMAASAAISLLFPSIRRLASPADTRPPP